MPDAAGARDWPDLSAAELEQRWQQAVRPDLFTGARRKDDPAVILIGGQPGAGKTAGLTRARVLYPGRDFVPIIGDDLRAHHPRYRELLSDPDPAAMPAATAQASAAWVRRSISHAQQHGYDAVVEGTFRNPETTLQTARGFAEAGHRVHVVALAVPAAESRLGCLDRYYSDLAAGQAARWTPMAAHDAGYEGTPRTLAAAQQDPAVHRITVTDRSGALLYDNVRGPDGAWQSPPGAVEALQERRSHPMTAAETESWLQRHARVVRLAAASDSTEEARAALRQLATNADILTSAPQLDHRPLVGVSADAERGSEVTTTLPKLREQFAAVGKHLQEAAEAVAAAGELARETAERFWALGGSAFLAQEVQDLIEDLQQQLQPVPQQIEEATSILAQIDPHSIPQANVEALSAVREAGADADLAVAGILNGVEQAIPQTQANLAGAHAAEAIAELLQQAHDSLDQTQAGLAHVADRVLEFQEGFRHG